MYGNERLLPRRDPARFAVAPGLDEEGLREGAFGLGFVQAQAPVPISQPLQQLRIGGCGVGSVIKLEFPAQERARHEGSAVVEHLWGAYSAGPICAAMAQMKPRHRSVEWR
jgi:hypothetical protein